MAGSTAPLDPRTITRPDPVLRKYYIIVAFCSGPGVVIALPVLMFKYATLRYRFDDEGIAMSWGVLFRREVYLTYRRIQDIHVTRGIIQRWLGIATISVQTASGSSGAEMQIEGIVEYETLRDFLYRRMRGAHQEAEPGAEPPVAVPPAADEALRLLREIHTGLQALRAGRAGTEGRS